MGTEMNILFNVLSSYKRSIVEILDKIDDNVLQAVSNHEDTHTSASIEKKYKLSMEMTRVLQTYVKMLYSIETLSEELGTKLFDLERDSQPQRGKRMSNPFILSACQDSIAKISFEHPSLQSNESFSCGKEPKTKTAPKTPAQAGDALENEEPIRTLEKMTLTSPEASFVDDVKSKVEDLINLHSSDDLTSGDNIQPDDIKIENDSAQITPTSSESSLDVEVKAEVVAEYNSEADDSASVTSSDTIKPDDVKIDTESNPFKLNNSNCDLEPEILTSSEVKKEHIEVPPDGTRDKVEPLLKSESRSPEGSRSKPYSPKSPKRIAVRSPGTHKSGSQRSTYNNYSPPRARPKGENDGSAEKKLMEMCRRNLRNEVKPPENGSAKKEVKWLITPPKNSRQPLVQPKDKNAIFDIIENELVAKMDCFFCHIESPFEIYVREYQDMFELLESDFSKYMNDHYSYVKNCYKSKTETRTRLGHFCFTFLPDTRKWYRVEVLDWMENDDETVLVQLIDYGPKIFLNFKNLKSMNETYALVPRIAIRCHLAGVYSSNPESRTKWPRASVDYFIQLTEIVKKTRFKVIYAQKEGGSYATDFCKADEEDPDPLGQQLVRGGYAFAIDIKSNDPLATIDEDDLEEYDNINEAITGYDARDEARICPFTDKSGGCFKGPSCKLEHTKLSADGITTDKILTTNQALQKFRLPQPGEHVAIYVTGYIDTCHFYAHILQNCDQDSHYNTEFKNLKDAMMANNMVQTYEPFKLFPTRTELVLVKEGLEWHRGTCVDYINDNKVEVLLVDYGFKRIKNLKDLRQMKEEFLHVPFQAVQCILSDCQEKKDTSMVESRNFFDRCIKGQTLHGLVVESSTEPISLQLWDAEGEMSLSHALKQCGIGEPRNDLRPIKDSILSTE